MSYEVWGDGDDQVADPDWQDQATEAGWLNPEMEAKAIMDVFRERHRQQHEQAGEGFTAEHDDRHAKGELVAAAVCYVLSQCKRLTMGMLVDVVNRIWPFEVKWLAKGHGDRRSLVIAAALLIAEIERLDRAAARAQQEEKQQ